MVNIDPKLVPAIVGHSATKVDHFIIIFGGLIGNRKKKLWKKIFSKKNIILKKKIINYQIKCGYSIQK